MQKHGIPPIDLVVVNLYPFAQTVAKTDCTLEDAIENIDIGGPTMVRAAAKNHGNEAGGVGIITDPADYAPVLAELKANGGALSYKTRFALAKKAFTHTARYDAGDRQLADQPRRRRTSRPPSPSACNWPSTRSTPCATARTRTSRPPSTANPSPCPAPSPTTSSCRARNSPTTTSATPMRPGNASRPSTTTACVIVKHANPCGVAIGADRAGRLPEGLQDRPDLGLRRHHRLQLRHRQGDRRSGRRPVRRSASSPRRSPPRPAPCSPPSRTCAC